MPDDLLVEQSLADIVALLKEHGLLCGGNGLQPSEEKTRLAPCYDSRLLEARHLFVAIAGEYFDGHDFIPAALARGCKAVVCEILPEKGLAEQLEQRGILVLQVTQSRQALSLLSASCFILAKGLQVLGVTGTDGKSSIAYFIYQILGRSSKVGLLSTFALDLGDGLRENPAHQTTPESVLVHRALAQMGANGCKYAVLECSSHGLSEKTARLQHVEFAAAVFSNLSPEHLEFHGSMECYTRDKASLFSRLRPNGVAVWNMDEHSSELLYRAATLAKGIRHIGYGMQSAAQSPAQAPAQSPTQSPTQLPAQSNGAHKKIPFAQRLLAENIDLQIDGSRFDILRIAEGEEPERHSCQIAIPGSAYVANTLAALALCAAVQQQEILGDMEKNAVLAAPKGRMQLLPSSAPFSVLVDYAHSPGSFARLLPEMRALLAQNRLGRRPGRLLLLFGSGGERDRSKRPRQGQLAAKYADIIVLCNEDPRNEDPMGIIDEIRAGIPSPSFQAGKNLFLLPNRREAIGKILSEAREGDLVMLLGKGHETSIIVEGLCELPWNEFEAAKEVLQAMGYSS